MTSRNVEATIGAERRTQHADVARSFLRYSQERIEIQVGQEEIAVMANVARTTVSRVLSELASADLINIGYGRLTLVACSKLRAVIGE